MNTSPQTGGLKPEGTTQPILVTGAHRSGTTWVGKMLCAGGEAGYISEPLNVHHRYGVMRIPIKHWYTYICEDNQDEYLPAFQETIRFQYHTQEEIRSLRSLKDCGRFFRDWFNFNSARRRNLRPLIKDPFAVFSAPWFFKTLKCQVVIVVRHPAPFASSLKRLGWSFDFEDLVTQPLLVRDRLGPFKSDLDTIKDEEVDIIDQACLLWRIIYSNVLEYLSKFPQFKVVRHEDLSTSPVKNFQNLYRELGLTYDPGVEDKIVATTNSLSPELEPAGSPHNIRRDSLQNLSHWKRHLTQEETTRIEGQTLDIASRFYPEGSPG